MENRSLEFRRQIFHLFLGITILALLILQILTVKVLLVVFLVGLSLSLLSLKCRIPFICWFLDRFERRDSFPGKGALFFFVGSMLALVLFPRNVALASIAILTFGDSIAPLVGIYFGRFKSRINGRRYLEGFAAGFVISCVAASIFVPVIPAVVGSFFALSFEFLEFRFRGFSIDDNLFIPLISGAVIYFIVSL